MPRQTAAQKEATAPRRNVFDTATPVSTVLAPNAQDRTVQRETKNLRVYTALCANKKTVEALVKTEAPEIHDQMIEYYVTEGCRIKQTPANYEGIEGDAKASLQLKKKSSQQPLLPEEVEALRDAGITLKRNVLVPKSFVVNPDYLENSLLIRALGEMIGDMVGKTVEIKDGRGKPQKVVIPDDIFNIQFEQATDIIADESLNDIFRQHSDDPDKVRVLLRMCCQLSISPEWTGDPKEAAKLAHSIVFADQFKPDPERAEAKAKVMEKDAEERKKRILGSGKKPAAYRESGK